MQYPFTGCCLSPKFIFLGLGCLGVALGVLSMIGPRRSISLYQGIMERFNWRVAPIDEPHEIRNTRVLGVFLVVLSFAIFVITLSKF